MDVIVDLGVCRTLTKVDDTGGGGSAADPVICCGLMGSSPFCWNGFVNSV